MFVSQDDPAFRVMTPRERATPTQMQFYTPYKALRRKFFPPMAVKKVETLRPVDPREVFLQNLDRILASINGGASSAAPSVRRIIAVVCVHFEISVSELQSRRRDARIVLPRQVAMYLSKTLTIKSLPEIGRCFNGRDHTTVLHAVRKVERKMATDESMRIVIEKLREYLGVPIAHQEAANASIAA